MTFIVTGADIETTGLDQESGHRIIEVAFSLYKTVDGESFTRMGRTWTQRINPLRPIDKEAEAVHGISLADLRGQPEWGDVAPKVYKILSSTNLFVAHNSDFDAHFIALELARLGYKVPDLEVFCTMQNGRHATPLGKVPNLGELCFAYGVDYDPSKAHAADYDVDVTMECFFRGYRKGHYQPESLQKYRHNALLKSAAGWS